MPNTLVKYFYRDDDDHQKLFSSEIVSGELTLSERNEIINECLLDGKFFYPEDVGLPNNNRFYGEGADHDLFDLVDITTTESQPTLPMTAEELLSNFRKIKNSW